MKEKSLEFLLESWGAAGGPNIYRKAVPSCGTSNTVNDSKKPTLGWKLEVFE